jgi:ribonuclease J
MFKPDKTYVFALGGLGEIGKNMYCFMQNDEIIIVDAGVIFPDSELRGIDYVLPDFDFLKKNEKKIKTLIITHGHEDHIGAIPFLLQNIHIPTIFAPNQAYALIKKKLEDRNIQYKGLRSYKSDDKLKYKNFEVSFFRTTHSVPDSHGIVIKTSNGTIVETGDFKFDLTPIGPVCDLAKIAQIGTEGVTLLMTESTNVLDEGFSLSESKVDEALNEVFSKHQDNRLIIATFASNIYRLKHIIETCKKFDRKICIFGRSMENNINISIEGGYIDAKNMIVTPEVANSMDPSKVALLCTGTQGEPLAALSRIADGIHKQIKLMPNDIVIFSSSAIPGNANAIANTINNLYLKGVKVYTTSNDSEIHASGHGMTDELKLMIRLTNPKYVMPIHGEYRMLKRHAQLATECDVLKENTFVLDNGDVLEMDKGHITKVGSFDVLETYVDGNRIGDISTAVLNDRKNMANDGILVVIANINIEERIILSKPMVTTRGFILINENEELIKQIEKISENTITTLFKNKKTTFNDIKLELTKTLTQFVKESTGRKPIVLTVLLNSKKK